MCNRVRIRLRAWFANESNKAGVQTLGVDSSTQMLCASSLKQAGRVSLPSHCHDCASCALCAKGESQRRRRDFIGPTGEQPLQEAADALRGFGLSLPAALLLFLLLRHGAGLTGVVSPPTPSIPATQYIRRRMLDVAIVHQYPPLTPSSSNAPQLTPSRLSFSCGPRRAQGSEIPGFAECRTGSLRFYHGLHYAFHYAFTTPR